MYKLIKPSTHCVSTSLSSSPIVHGAANVQYSLDGERRAESIGAKNLAIIGNQLYEVVHVDWSPSNETSALSQAGLRGSGLTLAGYCPCYVDAVKAGGWASELGVRRGDHVIEINGINCSRATIKSVLGLLKTSSLHGLRMTLYRPVAAFGHPDLPNKRQDKSKLRVNFKRTGEHGPALLANLFKPFYWFSTLTCTSAASNDMTMNSSIYSPSAAADEPSELNHSMVNHYELSEDAPGTKDISGPHKSCESTEMVIDLPAFCSEASSHHETAKSVGDTGYESLSRIDYALSNQCVHPAALAAQTAASVEDDITIETVTDTTNSYSDCDLTVGDYTPNTTIANKCEKMLDLYKQITRSRANLMPSSCSDLAPKVQQAPVPIPEAVDATVDANKVRLVDQLLDMEAEFIAYASRAVAIFSCPLRPFFMKKQDYYCLFQNIEKIVVINEHSFVSLKKLPASDRYARIGQLYSQKLSLLREALATYVQGYARAKNLLRELVTNSNQLRKFLRLYERPECTLERFLDLPLILVAQTLELFKRLRPCVADSRRNPSEGPHIDSVVYELRKILGNQRLVPVYDAATDRGVCNANYSQDAEDEASSTSALSICTIGNFDESSCILRRKFRGRRFHFVRGGRARSQCDYSSCYASRCSASASSFSTSSNSNSSSSSACSPILIL